MAQPFAQPCDQGVIDAQPCPRQEGRELPRRQRAMVLTACILASSMAFIDGSALTVALPALRQDLGDDLATLQWVLNGYVVVLAAFILIGGSLADVYGKARMLAVGSAGFGLASVACALAPTTEWLIGARVVQGVAAAILTPASLALIGTAFPKAERNQAIGMWAAASALTTAGGPILGGWLTEQFGWPAVFWINPPIALIAVAIVLSNAPAETLARRRFDIAGAAIMATALTTLAWVLSAIGPGEAANADQAQTPSPMPLLLAAGFGVAGLLGFVMWERRTAHPMTPPRMFRNRSFAGLNAATLLIYAALSIMFFLLPFELVDRRGLSPSQAGLMLLPFTLGVGLLSRPFGRLADRIGARSLMIGGPIGAGLAYLLLAIGTDASLAAGVILPMVVLGLAFAVLVAPLTASVMSSVADSDEGLASGINNTASRIAQLVGVALAAGLASFEVGYVSALLAGAIASLLGALVVAVSFTPSAARGA